MMPSGSMRNSPSPSTRATSTSSSVRPDDAPSLGPPASHRRAGYAPTAAELEPLVIRGLKPGDVVMVKGSRGSRMAPLVETLKATYEAVPAEDLQGAT